MAKIKALRVASRRPGFRRAGLTHPAQAVLHPLESLTEEQIAQLKAEPLLVVEEVEIEESEKGGAKPEASGKPAASVQKGGARKPVAPVKGKPAPAAPASADPAPGGDAEKKD